MPEIIDRRISFNAGELSPWLDPRIDMDKYRMGCRQLQNMRPTIYGGAIRRPGTEYCGASGSTGADSRLIPFVREVETNYVLEFTALKMRVWDASTKALVMDGGSPLSVTTPFTAAQLAQVQYVQQNDVVFLTHPDHFPKVVSRLGTGQWAISNVNIEWPVTLGPNVGITEIWPLVDIYNVGEPAAWTAAADTAGTKHKYDGRYFIAVTATLSTDIPGTEAARGKWVEGTWINAASPSTPTAYSSGTYYVTGNLITYSSKVYVRRKDYSGQVKGWTPAEDGDFAEIGGEWAAGNMWDLATTPEVEDAKDMVPKGGSLILKSSAAVWGAHHVGTQFVIGHRRDAAKVSFKTSEQVVGYVTEPLYVVGEWTCQITQPTAPTNAYEVGVLVERSTDLITWEVHHAVNSQLASVQQLLSGSEADPIFLRLRLAIETGAPPSALGVELVAGNPLHQGVVTIIGFTSATEVTAVIDTPLYRYLPTTIWEEPAWHSVFGFPRAVALHEQRLFFAGNKRKPTTIWGSAIDAYQDFRLATNDDRAVVYTLASDESSVIEWLVSQDVLAIGTSTGEWVIQQRPGEDAPKLRSNTRFGSAPVQAKAITDSIIYCQRSRLKVQEFAWSFESDRFASNNLNMLAEHLGDARFLQMAIQRNPESVVWVVTERGDLLSLVYERGQGVTGWARHVTDGKVRALAVVLGSGEEDHVWIIVERIIGGVTVQYVERFQPDLVRAIKKVTVADYTFVDCAKKYSGSGMTAITGMSHLAGKTVSVVGDGKPQADKVVSGSGTLTITACNTAVIGLPYTSTLEPTYLETPDPSSMTKVAKKRLHRAVLELWQSYGMEISADDGATWQALAIPITPDFDAAAGTLFTGLHEHYLEASTERQASVIVRQTKPAPLALMALMMRYQVEGA